MQSTFRSALWAPDAGFPEAPQKQNRYSQLAGTYYSNSYIRYIEYL